MYIKLIFGLRLWDWSLLRPGHRLSRYCLCHVFTIPEWAKKCIIKATWGLFWSGRRDLVAHHTVCLPKGQGGFGLIDFDLNAKAFAIQWVKCYLAPTPAKWKAFFSFFCMSCLSVTPVEAFSTSSFPHNLIALLPSFYQHIIRAWSQFDGGAVDGLLSLEDSSNMPRPLAELNSHSSYTIGRCCIMREPHCIGKFLPQSALVRNMGSDPSTIFGLCCCGRELEDRPQCSLYCLQPCHQIRDGQHRSPVSLLGRHRNSRASLLRMSIR